jgi:tRNA (mo5U34)-methyltransferase
MATNLQAAAPVAHPLDKDALEKQIASLGQWFHNIDIFGVPTAPAHFLGDYPNIKWKHLQHAFPEDMKGASVLDIGCNAGFYSIGLKRRNAGRVLGLDVDDRYLNQGRFAAKTLGLDIEFQKSSVYEVDQVSGQFDWVLFLGVFYHLRYPLLALDKVVTKIKPGGKLVFQTMLRGSRRQHTAKDDYDFWQENVFAEPDFPCAYFIEKSYSHDPTNWFIPNRSGAEAMLRSAGLEIVEHPEPETWVCQPTKVQRDGRYILDLELEGSL